MVRRNRLAHALLFLVAAFFAGTPFTAGPTVSEAMNLLALGLCMAVGVVYAPDLLDALRAERPSQGDWLGAGICIGWFSSACLKADGEAISLGYPEVLNSVHHAFLILMQVVGALCHLIAPHARLEHMKRQASVIIGITVGMTCVLSVALFEARSYKVLAPPRRLEPHDVGRVPHRPWLR